MQRFAIGLVAALGLSGITAKAESYNLSITTSDITLGTHLMGPAVSAADLRGKVLLLEFWGINCPPCIASLPKLEALHKELAPKGLVIIGAHAQQGTADQIRAMARSKGVTFSVQERANVRNGNDFNGIPHCMLFDHTGKCIYRGSPGEADAKAREAVMRTPAGMLGDRELVKLAGLAAGLKRGQTPGAILKQAQKLTEDKDSAKADEAKYIVETLSQKAQSVLDSLDTMAKENPVEALNAANQLGREYNGTDYAKQAAAKIAEWKKDKAFADEMKAHEMLEGIRKLQTQLRELPGRGLGTEAFKADNYLVLGKISQTATQMKKTWPHSTATQQAVNIALNYGLQIP